MKKCQKDCVSQPITCPQELYRACKLSIGDTTACKACVDADAANLTTANCTQAYKDDFCAIPTMQCAEVLLLECGLTAGVQETCVPCLQKNAANLTAAGCQQSALDEFCGLQLPAYATCAEALVSNCYKTMTSDIKCAACEVTHRAALKAANCSELYKTAFCAIPNPVCVQELMLNCGLTIGDADQCKACEIANADALTDCGATNLNMFCTLAGDVPALPPMPPGPAGCAIALADSCVKSKTTLAECTACQTANKADLDAANCTQKDLDMFCEIPLAPCLEAFSRACLESVGDEDRCKVCEQKNAVTLSAAGCTATNLGDMCTIVPSILPPLPPMDIDDIPSACVAGICVPDQGGVPRKDCLAACA